MESVAVERLFLQEGRARAKVAVGVTVYNYERYLAACLASVAAQTLPELDLVVLDDCSGDASCGLALAWLKTHAGRFNRVELLRTQQNSGVAAAHNATATAARCDNVLLLDADNELLPCGLEMLLSALEGSGADFAFGLLERFGEEAAVMHNVLWDPDLLGRCNYWDTLGLIRRDTLYKLGGFNDLEGLGWDDYVLWCKLAPGGGWGVHVAQFVGRYRVHPKSICSRLDDLEVQRHLDVLSAHFPEVFKQK
ncbi:MAG: glycosyltransferase family 2 protein [Desulfarculaceae bacterium]|nr:glycosyltransferase family 2 protein [Desulfarculaceae bacterium]MCF8047420.1 glycosyltransferase family 2 protein [Desulfarculaceae bacterium]MCF8063987.1 glycosyltransferase family 2 protein [Desulfarculaceae bacterium]MCF8097026.1 glycosyltransferase family 2 protein [Desulfarculaceae bacterium]MCF8122078.1 glycosyltransferase family 2 protein [Desulfarculaceae bacterium]